MALPYGVMGWSAILMVFPDHIHLLFSIVNYENILSSFKFGMIVLLLNRFMVRVSHAILSSVYCILVVTFWERADLLALLYVMFYCVFVTFPCGVLGQMWYLIVSNLDLCLLSCFKEMKVKYFFASIGVPMIAAWLIGVGSFSIFGMGGKASEANLNTCGGGIAKFTCMHAHTHDCIYAHICTCS